MLELQDESSIEHSASQPSAPGSSAQQQQQEKDDREPPSLEKNGQRQNFSSMKSYFEKERLRSQHAPQPRNLTVSYHQGNHYAVPLRNESLTARKHQVVPARSRSSLVLGDDEDKEWITIKCNCSRTSEDGNMLYCEDCDTWQHMKCYYPGQDRANRTSEGDCALEHCCADCKQTPLDEVDSERWELINAPISF